MSIPALPHFMDMFMESFVLDRERQVEMEMVFWVKIVSVFTVSHWL